MHPTPNTFNPETIRQQITPMVLISCAARNYVAGEDFLMFQVGSKPRIVEKVIVTYVSVFDTYTVRYVAMKRSDFSTIADESIPMVYADQLPKIVREMGDRG
jgi:hypothetical protein